MLPLVGTVSAIVTFAQVLQIVQSAQSTSSGMEQLVSRIQTTAIPRVAHVTQQTLKNV